LAAGGIWESLQQPTKFEAAKALGVTVPPSLLAIADEVIEWGQ
jgi:hypothetical protein